MGFGERIANGWALTKQSLEVLRLDKELLIFPVLSAIAAILVAASFIVPLWTSGYIESIAETEGAPVDYSVYVLLFLFYFANYAVMIFFNAAIVSCALKRLRGGDPTVGFGLQSAMGLLPQILAWALLSATVGFVLRMIEEKAEGLGRFVVGLIGVAWSVATYFVVPVLVVERVGPFAALKRSASILRRAWGEALVSKIGMGFIIFGAALLAMLPAILGVALGTGVTIAVGVGVTVVAFLLVMAASTALQAIMVTALYEYATEGSAPAGFDEHVLQSAFGPKAGRRGRI